jgi:hypothetical protein
MIDGWEGGVIIIEGVVSGKQKGCFFSNLQQWSTTNGIGNSFLLGFFMCQCHIYKSLFKKMLMS